MPDTDSPLILALDQGTTSSRALLFDAGGQVRAMAQRELPQSFPQPGWVEHDPEQIWQTQLACAREALDAVPHARARTLAVGIANQRETTVLWERASGRPLAPAIVWQDRRTADHCARLAAQGQGEAVRARTGLLLDPYFSATKLAWLLDQVPGARGRALRGELAFGTVDSWLAWRLTGGAAHVTDPGNASRTLLMDLERGQWDPQMLATFDVPESLLPRIVPSSGVVGTCLPELLGAPLPLAALAGDQQAATFGQACFAPGQAKNTYGTGCFLLSQAGTQRPQPAAGILATAACQLPGQAPEFLLEGSVFTGGAVVQWLRDGLGLIRSAAEIEALAASVPDSGGVECVPAFTGLGAPYWDPHARGALLGLTRGSTRAHIARAALESIALQTTELVLGLQPGGAPLAELRVDGGAAANDLLMQTQADLLGIAVLRPECLETTALGAAWLAGLAVGLWPDRAALTAGWRVAHRFEPAWSADRREARLAQWREAVHRVLDGAPGAA
jgi:glycerol kinase